MSFGHALWNMLHCVRVHVCTCRAKVKIDSDVESEDGLVDSKEGLLDLTVKVMDSNKVCY